MRCHNFSPIRTGRKSCLRTTAPQFAKPKLSYKKMQFVSSTVFRRDSSLGYASTNCMQQTSLPKGCTINLNGPHQHQGAHVAEYSCAIQGLVQPLDKQTLRVPVEVANRTRRAIFVCIVLRVVGLSRGSMRSRVQVALGEKR